MVKVILEVELNVGVNIRLTEHTRKRKTSQFEKSPLIKSYTIQWQSNGSTDWNDLCYKFKRISSAMKQIGKMINASDKMSFSIK